MTQTTQSPWVVLLNKSLESRFHVKRFEAFTELLAKKNIPPRSFELVKTIFDSQCSSSSGVDPLVPLYVECMLNNSWMNECDVLQFLLHSFQHRTNDLEKLSVSSPEVTNDSKSVSPQLEEVLFGLVVNEYATGTKPSNSKEAQKAIKVAVDWMAAIAGSDRAMLLSTESLPQEMFMIRVALGTLLVTLLGHSKIRSLLDPSLGNGILKTLTEPLNAFIPLLNQISPLLAQRLEFQAHDLMVTNFGTSHDLGLNVSDIHLSGVVDGAPVLNRASLFVFLESLFHGWPSLEDTTVLTYIRARYKGDTESSISDLILASFDLNMIAMSRADSPRDTNMYHLFLTEKLPHLILSLTTETFVPIDITFVISQAFQRMMIDDRLRQDFLLGCSHLGILSDDNVESLLGSKPTYVQPRGGKVVRETLIQEYRKDPSRAEQFANRVGMQDGNCGIYAEVVLEILNHLCAVRDTMSMRGLCNAIACNSNALDAMALYSTPSRFLGPICRLLDAWSHEEDQGEYQPVYDEFGACFLLVMACVHRFGLQSADLSAFGSIGLVAHMLDVDGWTASAIKHLSQDQQKHLSGWVRALFETEGISDELMSACPPQEFYKIVPTIFSQSVIACRTDILDMEKIKNGLELLLEPFLVPCIIPGINALICQAWMQQADTGIILRVLRELIMPSSVRSPTHDAVISIVAKDLEQCLKEFKRRNLQIEEVDVLLERLQPTLQSSRGIRSNSIATATGLVQSSGNILDTSLSSFAQDLQSLFSWSYGTSAAAQTPSYNYKKLHALLQYHGGAKVLNAILNELKTFAQSPVMSYIALDIATTLICMPDKKGCATSMGASHSSLSRLTLNAALHLEQQDTAKTSVTDPLRAELITKLYRHLAAYPVDFSSIVDIDAPIPSILDTTMELEPATSTIDLTVSQVEATLAQDDATSMNFIPVEENTFNLDMDAALASASLDQTYGDVPQSAEDDWGLDFDTEMDFS